MNHAHESNAARFSAGQAVQQRKILESKHKTNLFTIPSECTLDHNFIAKGYLKKYTPCNHIRK